LSSVGADQRFLQSGCDECSRLSVPGPFGIIERGESIGKRAKLTQDERRLPQLEFIGDATTFAGTIHGMVGFSPLFGHLDLSDIRLLSQFLQVYRAQSGGEIIREGDPGDFLMFVIEGRIEVIKKDRQRAPRVIAVVEPGQTLGEMSMIDGEPRFATCIAATPALLAVLTRDSFARIILDQPLLGAKILMEMVHMLSLRLRRTSARLLAHLDRERDIREAGRDGAGFV